MRVKHFSLLSPLFSLPSPLSSLLSPLFSLLFLLLPLSSPAQQPTDSERLGMAIEYFQSGKYHEALLLFQRLDRQYRLNPRFRAYIGVCHYYEWQYAEATQCLDSVIPRLHSFAPQERSFYYYADAESHFNLGHYDRALPLYEEMLTLCRDNEKPDAYFRIGFIHVEREEWVPALDNLQSALVYYQRHRPDAQARIAQIKAMLTGCCRKIEEQRLKGIRE